MSIDQSKFRADFADWLVKNHHIWQAFSREANRIWDRGRRHWSARTIIEYLRHETALREVSGDFKIDGNYVSSMARLYMETFPERVGFFETRDQARAA